MVQFNNLTHLKVKNLDAGKYSDGQGLWLHKRRVDAGKWILRVSIAKKRREMGLGRWPDVSIAEARERASQARRQVRDGLDPIVERSKQRASLDKLLFADAVQGCYEARQAELKNDGKAGRWLSPLNTHVLPKIGNRAVEDIDQHVLKTVLEPIWHTKADSARKALNRINLTLKHAAALGIDVDLQAAMKVRALLGRQRHTVKHIPSMPYEETPAFYAELCKKNGMAALALRFLILTGVRSAGVRFMTLDEIQDDVWLIPAGRSKTNQEHRVPLSAEAIRVVQMASSPDRAYVFSNANDKALSDVMMSKLMKDAGYEARPHGFRSTLRTWLEEQTDASFEVKETMLAHQVGSKVTQAYQRSDHLEKRTTLMESWSTYLIDTVGG